MSTRKWGRIAIGLALFPAMSALESRLWAQAYPNAAPVSAVRETALPSKDADAARDLMKRGRAALQSGDFARAEQMARQAQGMKVALPFWEGDTPEKLIADVANAKAYAIPHADAKTLLKLGREAMAAGKFDDAAALHARVSGMNVRWGFLDDNPAKFNEDLAKARGKAEKAEAIRLLTDARKMYDQGRLDDAEVMAYRAERLHGGFSLWDGGEKPQKLLSEIQTARAKTRRMNNSAVAKNAPEPAWPAEEPKSEIIQTGAVERAGNPAREKAEQLMMLGKADMKAGRMSEARVKFLEAQRTCRDFRPDEENPIRCLGDLVASVGQQCRDAAKDACTANDPPEIRSVCEARLMKVRQLAREFGLDAKPIDDKLMALRGGTQPSSPSDTGRMLIEKARLEIQRGALDVARQLATEAYNGPYNVKADAAALLRSVDAEETNRKSGEAVKGFQAAAAAFVSQDYAQAHGILCQVDATCLPEDQRLKHNEMVTTCVEKMAAGSNSKPVMDLPAPIMPASGAEPAIVPIAPPPALEPAAPPALIPSTPAPMIPSTPAPAAKGDDLNSQVKALQKVEFQRLRSEGQRIESDAAKAFERGETDTALEMLQAFMNKLKGSQLEAREVALLQRPVEQRLQTLKMLKSQKDFETKTDSRKKNSDLEKGRLALIEDRKREQIKDLMKQYNTLIREGKFREAQVVAAKARELDPDDPALQAAEKVAQISFSQASHDGGKNASEKMFVNRLNEVEAGPPDVGDSKPLHIDPSMMKTANDRGKGTETINLQNKTEAERDINHKLTMPVDLNFQSTPLRQVLDDLKVMTGMNIVPDVTALEDEHVSLDQPVTMKVDHLALKSALKLLLSSVRLTYVVSDDVLKVTTEKRARGKLVQKVYRVTDLVMPIEDYQAPASQSLQRTMDRIAEQQNVKLGGATPFNNGRFMLGDGQAVGGPQGGASMTTAPGQSIPGMSQIGAPTTQKQTQHEMLMKLIQNTISPQTWAEVGGAGTIDYMPIGMALVINQTVDVQEQVQELLDALRRLQDLQVAVEIKLITLSETFFERIGLDFNLNVKTDKNTSRFEPQLTTGQFKPAGQVNDFSPRNFLSGITPAGTLTSDLDVPIRSSSFQYGIPPFAFPNNAGFNGGLSMGLAFLSDIQVYMFMEAAQGDRRIHVMQAPKLTLFNGQSATINVLDQQFFVTNVNVIGFGGQIVFAPVNHNCPLGAELTMQAVVSADRRFVRMNINQRLSNLASANVPLFPVTTFITPVFEGGAQGQPIPFTQFIQQPQFSLVQIQTTVSVPDGGTVILGGLKTLSEGRNEFGPPVLSKVPYVNRLFKNVGFGREAQSLLIMVTPRIIINAEEEVRQTEIDSRPDQ